MRRTRLTDVPCPIARGLDEVGHVFAIQESKNHVPRWFTEGLSEYETIIRRPEWAREEDQALYLALRRGVPVITLELPNAAQMPTPGQAQRIWGDMLVWLEKNLPNRKPTQYSQLENQPELKSPPTATP